MIAESNQVRSLKSLKDEIRSDVFAGNEQENLIRQHDNLFIEGLSEIQKWVDTEKERQCNVVQFCKTYFKNGMTVISAPRGVIHRVYTVADQNWRNPIFYTQTKLSNIENFSNSFRALILPLSAGDQKLPLGFQRADPSSDLKFGTSKKFNRAASGYWCIHDRNIYISPWIQSNEMVVVEWSGIKTSSEWSDDDLVSDAVDFKKTLKLYLQYSHERDFGSNVQSRELLRQDWDEALADLMWQSEQEIKLRETESHYRGYHRSFIDDILGLKPLPAPQEPPKDQVIFAHIGNNGSGTPDALNVSALVKTWKPKFIVATGGNTFKDANSSKYLDYDVSVGSLFADYLNPYIGQYQAVQTGENHFWPAVDNADWANSALAPFEAFFRLPNNNRYYDVCFGAVHIFFVDGSTSEPDGITATSKQAKWLQVALMLSTAIWKVVVMAQPPFTSDTSAKNAALQWPFDAWGADIVLSGRAMSYERFSVGRFPYIVNGLGGRIITPQDFAQAGNSMKQYSDNFGAGRVTADGSTFLYEFFAVDGTLIDSFTLTKG